MQIKISTDEGEKTIEMRKVKNKHVEQLMKVLKSMNNLKEDQAIIKLNDLLDVRNNIAKELAGFTDKDWSELNVDDAEKFTKVVAQAAFGDLDFSRLFRKQQG